MLKNTAIKSICVKFKKFGMNPKKNGNENYPVAKVQKQSDLFYVLCEMPQNLELLVWSIYIFFLQITSYDHSIEFGHICIQISTHNTYILFPIIFFFRFQFVKLLTVFVLSYI
jgi:hypothetical protein